jgi:hypothetical protein
MIPSVATKKNDAAASVADALNASAMIGATGRSMTSEWPRSPRRIPDAQRQYCT